MEGKIMNVISLRTDLAMESHDLALKQKKEHISGVKKETEELNGINITRVVIDSLEGAKALGKPQGRYVTIEAPTLRNNNKEIEEEVIKVFTQEFFTFLEKNKLDQKKSVLVIGLGNWNVTPDALGPLVVENILVTRHYKELMPELLNGSFREVSAIAPGVLGITGIETSDIVNGVIKQVEPDFIIAIDALAALSLERVNTTIQISDTGIRPGSGVGNKRKALNRETLGIPVIAIGVPTVVDASTIAHDVLEYTISYLENQSKEKNNYFGLVGTLSYEEKHALIREALTPLGQNLIVTPKEVDEFVENIANIIASGLNQGLHQEINGKNVNVYTH